MAFPLLYLTDGTTRLNLLGTKDGFILKGYRPGRVQMKDGGIWNDSDIADFRFLVDSSWASIVDVFDYNIAANCQDNNIDWSQKLDTLLIKAVGYWKKVTTNISTEVPIYLVRRGPQETNTSYAIVTGFKLPDGSNPFAEPFYSYNNSVDINVKLAIEHLPWQDNIPGEYNDTPIGTLVGHNLIENGNFYDVSGTPVGWTLLNAPTVTIEALDYDFIDIGDKSVNVSTSAGAYRGLYQDIAVRPNAEYTARIRIYVNTGTWYLMVYNSVSGSPSTPAYVEEVSDVGWNTIEFTCNAWNESLRFLVCANGNAEAYIDNASFVRYHGTDQWENQRFLPRLGNQDCYVDVNGTSIDTTDKKAQAGRDSAGDLFHAGIWFPTDGGGLARILPIGAKIIKARVRLNGLSSSPSASANTELRIYGVDSNTLGAFTTYANFIALSKTTNYVDWSITSTVNADSLHETPDLTEILQEIIDRPGGWDNGIGILLWDNNVAANHLFTFTTMEDFDEAPAPRLYVQWEGVAGIEETELVFSDSNPIHVANKEHMANLTHVYRYDNANTAWNDLVGAPLDTPLFEGQDDQLYFGISTGVPNSGPFTSLVLDVVQAIVPTSPGTITSIWEYWSGAGWTAFTPGTNLVDHTNSGASILSRDGVNSVHWSPQTNWATVNLNGAAGVPAGAPAVTAWWVRANITAVSLGIDASALKGTGEPRTINNGHVQTDGENIAGQLTALSETIYAIKSDDGNATDLTEARRLMLTTRDEDSFPDFTPYLLCSDLQLPNWMWIELERASPPISYQPYIHSPTGRAIRYQTAGSEASFTDAFSIYIDRNKVPDFSGRFHMYIRGDNSSGGNILFKVRSNLFSDTETFTDTLGTTLDQGVYDMGEIIIPGAGMAVSDSYGHGWIAVQIRCTGATTFYLYDIILYPVDQSVCDLRTVGDYVLAYYTGTRTYESIMQLDVDSVRYPKRNLRGLLQRQDTGAIIDNWYHASNGPWSIEPEEDSKIYPLAWSNNNDPSLSCYPHIAGTMINRHLSRYSGLRGRK